MGYLSGPLAAEVANSFAWKFKHLGIDDGEELPALLRLLKVKGRASRAEDIVRGGSSSNYFTVLLSGMACRYKLIESGRRQIFMFQYPGDFCSLNRYALPELEDAVAALNDCWIGAIAREDIEQLTARYPKLAMAFWYEILLEAGIFRERLLNVSQQPALQRIAHLICEQMARLESIGANYAVIPLTQVDLSDAAGLSVVHMNRTVNELRELGVLSKNSRAIEVVDREKLENMAKFDGRYLQPQALSQWNFPPWINQDTRTPRPTARPDDQGTGQLASQATVGAP